MTLPKPPSDLRIGQRVCRTDSDELGTVIDVDGDIKVKWDSGQTSYFRCDKPANIKLKESNE
jgi:hypothetical protein